MALPSAFRERLENMEHTRNQRVSFLQAEKELQINKSQILASKLSDIRSMEQRCLKFDHKIASQQFIISSLKSEIDHLDSEYLNNLQRFRVLKTEVEELEELEKEKQRYFGSKTHEMEEFRARVKDFTAECHTRVEELRNCMKELKSTFTELKGNIGYSNNTQLAAAETRKSELLDVKQNLDRNMASSYQTKAQLQKQLRRILITQIQ
ncbi:hypothetical protein LguiA_025096 [Lonicera macranthoides]